VAAILPTRSRGSGWPQSRRGERQLSWRVPLKSEPSDLDAAPLDAGPVATLVAANRRLKRTERSGDGVSKPRRKGRRGPSRVALVAFDCGGCGEG
jgi:hypothetical protein